MTKSAALFFFALAGLSSSLMAQPFEQGTHYQRIGVAVAAPEDRVEVIEAFAYPCPACRNFYPIISRWEHDAPEYVDFQRLPVPLQRGWELFALGFYTAEVMGVNHDDAHGAVFEALHEERKRISGIEDVAEIYSQFDVTAESFINTSQSFAVDARMRKNRSDVGRFGIRQTPTVIVQGKWRLTPRNFESFDQMLDAVDYLVAMEAEALGLSEDGEASAKVEETAGE
ncbi:MAG: thioredoxin domain-containing protein [Gammaproteobacteria bacterium]|jgi:thiol:disulfide interchange protein DsbA|nr:thioredoxin domain-containing protein [Gammaproteobacteria bacterium]